jgi:phosphate transport system substrate-binding protein
MHRLLPALLALALLAVAGAAGATPNGRVIQYRGGAQGRVVFDVRVHQGLKAGLVCGDCHAGFFPMRKTGLISQADHQQGTACFGCHDGKRAFDECARCHAAS